MHQEILAPASTGLAPVRANNWQLPLQAAPIPPQHFPKDLHRARPGGISDSPLTHAAASRRLHWDKPSRGPSALLCKGSGHLGSRRGKPDGNRKRTTRLAPPLPPGLPRCERTTDSYR